MVFVFCVLITQSFAYIPAAVGNSNLSIGATIIGAEFGGEAFIPFNDNFGLGIGTRGALLWVTSLGDVYGNLRVLNGKKNGLSLSIIAESGRIASGLTSRSVYSYEGFGIGVSLESAEWQLKINYVPITRADEGYEGAKFCSGSGIELVNIPAHVYMGISAQTNYPYVGFSFWLEPDKESKK